VLRNRTVFLLLWCAACTRLSDDAKQVKKDDGTYRTSVFVAMPLERQINVYLELMSTEKPRPTGLGVLMAREGEPMALRILSRMHAETNDRNRYHLLTVLITMRQIDTYDICRHSGVLSSLRAGARDRPMSSWTSRYISDLAQVCPG
jgi:hypothetical protein